MRVCFLQNDPFMKQGVLVLSAVLKGRGHQTLVLIEPEERDSSEALRVFRPELFAFSISGGSERWLEQRIDELRATWKSPVIVGGSSPTLCPDMIERIPVDYLCRGEGAMPLMELCDALEQGEDDDTIPNIWTRRNGRIHRNEIRPLIEDLDALPFPDWSVYLDRYRFLRSYSQHLFSVTTGWGCTENCSYCMHSVFRKIYSGKGKYMRRKSPGRVIEELVEARRLYDIRRVKFEDDDFFASPKWLGEFSESYGREVALPFDCLTMASRLDEKAVETAVSMGCESVIIGLETANEDIRREVLGKMESDGELNRGIRLLKEAGIRVQTDNIYGIPGEDAERALGTYAFNLRHRVDFAHCSFLQPYPGSAIADKLAAYFRSRFGSDRDPQLTVLGNEYFYEIAFDVEDGNEIINLQRLTQLGLMMRLPLFLMRLLIRIPRNPLFDWVFSATFAYGFRKVKGVPWIPFLRMGWHARGQI